MTLSSNTDAITKAARLLQNTFPIPWHDLSQVAQDVVRTHPSAQGDDLVRLITEAALKQWSSGITCCDG